MSRVFGGVSAIIDFAIMGMNHAAYFLHTDHMIWSLCHEPYDMNHMIWNYMVKFMTYIFKICESTTI